jgi:hypothetical protein
MPPTNLQGLPRCVQEIHRASRQTPVKVMEASWPPSCLSTVAGWAVLSVRLLFPSPADPSQLGRGQHRPGRYCTGPASAPWGRPGAQGTRAPPHVRRGTHPSRAGRFLTTINTTKGTYKATSYSKPGRPSGVLPARRQWHGITSQRASHGSVRWRWSRG